MRRVLAVMALLPVAYIGALVLGAFFYGMSITRGDTWSWPTVFVVATWIFGVGAVVTGASLLACWGYDQLVDGGSRP